MNNINEQWDCTGRTGSKNEMLLQEKNERACTMPALEGTLQVLLKMIFYERKKSSNHAEVGRLNLAAFIRKSSTKNRNSAMIKL
jgi:hypothetical protein